MIKGNIEYPVKDLSAYPEIADKLREITGTNFPVSALEKFEKPTGSHSSPIDAVEDGPLTGFSGRLVDQGYDATFNLTLQQETIQFQYISGRYRTNPRMVVTKALNGLIYLAENPNAGCTLLEKRFMSR
jgi:hypothetical protein|tara:strand:- start:1592 stop:1978 length:387 start_codon:yes stop_codon:yes gene_type:complete